MKIFRLLFLLLITALSLLIFIPKAWAFCGFYVAKADTTLYNKASQVILARDGDRTILTMANDYQGDVADFAIVVPVPVVLEPEQVRVGEPKIIERLDQFSAPRLVEYFDSDPCDEGPDFLEAPGAGDLRRLSLDQQARESSTLGVTVEAEFSVGEYDIVILSARESNGLETWLRNNGYRIPSGAAPILQPYIRQNLKFFVAKVNLQEFEKSGYQFLRPLMMAYESPRFMLPIRLGMMNATSDQDLIVYVLSPSGQAEVTNYRTVPIASNAQIPVFVKDEFSDFYKSMFQRSYEQEGKNVAFVEYAWDMAWCDPCAANPLTPEELQQAGVFWLNSNAPNNVFITRFHVRYTRDKFPEDLMFQETSNRQLFQGRYILQHPYTGPISCDAGRDYQQSLQRRFEDEAQTLARLTGWKIEDIRRKMNIRSGERTPWWRNIWQ